MRYVPLFALTASPALAHTGAHVHPHDGVGWVAVAAALTVISVAGVLAVSRVGAGK